MLKRKYNLLIKTAVVLLISIMISGISGCGIKEPPKSGILAEDDELDISGDIVMTISASSDREEIAPKTFAKAFEDKYPDVRVTIDRSDRNTYSTRISTGEIGDIFWCDENDAYNYKKNHNAIMMLDYYIDKLGINTQNVYSGALRSGMIDGRLYMVPKHFGQMVLIYNKDAVVEKGISVPSGDTAMKWDYFKDICKQLTVTENDTVTQRGAGFRIWWGPVWLSFAAGWGGNWCDTSNKKVSFVSDELVMKGLQEMFDGCIEGWMSIEDPSGNSKDNLPMQSRVFRTFADLQWIESQGTYYDTSGVSWDFCPFPEFPVHSVCAGSTGYCVYNRTQNPDAAAALALFLLTEEGQRAYNGVSGGNVPLLGSLSEDTFWQLPDTKFKDKSFDAFVSYPDAAIPAVVILSAPYEIADILSDGNMINYCDQIIAGTRSVEDVFNYLETTCNETWKKLFL